MTAPHLRYSKHGCELGKSVRNLVCGSPMSLAWRQPATPTAYKATIRAAEQTRPSSASSATTTSTTSPLGRGHADTAIVSGDALGETG